MIVYVCIYIVSSILVPDTECKTTYILNISFLSIKMNMKNGINPKVI